MAQRFAKLIFLLCNLLLLSFNTQGALFEQHVSNRFLPVDQAFPFDFQQQDDLLILNWQTQPGYYLYRQEIKLKPSQVTIGIVNLPAGLNHIDEFFGNVVILKKPLQIKIPLLEVGKQASLSVTYQGCAESGFCYPPETRIIPLEPFTAANVSLQAPTSQSSGQPLALTTESNSPTLLPFSPLWALLLGMGIAFTPCVLPMYPLLATMILGREQRPRPGRLLLLGGAYVQGMAVTYTLLGMAVAAAGLQFQAALQQPYVLILFSLLFIALALSMFGCYSLQLPSALQTRLANWSNTQQGGSVLGVFVMGAIAGLICSPCTTAPLSAILLYIAQSGNLWVGAGTLYLYALGMGIPLVIITLFGSHLLPKRGPWMQHVKEAFGFIILVVPVFLLERIVSDQWDQRLWSLLAVAFFGWAFTVSLKVTQSGIRVIQVLLLALLVIAARPLQDWLFPSLSNQQQETSSVNFIAVTNVEQLYRALQQAAGRPVMLDFSADWCLACKQFEKYTFSDPAVQQTLSDWVLLQADVTANQPEHIALLKHLQILGLPSILFFDANGNEIAASRVTGFLDATDFSAHLATLDVKKN
ncbi:protein-disulfide reductase DsbD [Serratia microhaemolytica]|uniref:protein-disulfide reductase DsbD n=1 Tax=Serratia microhaemolytica TaxID=2675110 RepID=UPI000FDF1F64|nr:protein-disulfide reductase DsbD [Serratia microhaemolytica]